MPLFPEAIPCSNWITQSAPKAIFLCVHGLGLHRESYKPFGERMCRHGVASYAVDVRGFGSWTKKKPNLNFDSTVEDLKQVTSAIRNAHPGVPLFILGESLGAAVALKFAAISPHSIDGLVLCAPARTLYEHKRDVVEILFNLIKRPSAPIDLAKPVVDKATRHHKLKSSWMNDALSRLKFSPREIFHMDDFLKDSFRSAAKITDLPVLLIQGYGDRLISPRSTVEIFRELPTRDKDLVILGDAEHLIFQNPDLNEHSISIVLNWIDSHSRFCFLKRAS